MNSRPDSKSSQRNYSPSSKQSSTSIEDEKSSNSGNESKKKVVVVKQVERAYPFTDTEKSTYDRLGK